MHADLLVALFRSELHAGLAAAADNARRAFERERAAQLKRRSQQKLHGMRTHADNEKLRLKAEERRERAQIRKKERLKTKRHKVVEDEDVIAQRKAAFAAKKARRSARKAAA